MLKQKFSEKKNRRLVRNQQRLHDALRRLVQRNGIQCYIDEPQRRRNVMKHYLMHYHIIGSSVERFWFLNGCCILIGKAF